jgi:hypothetical protein
MTEDEARRLCTEQGATFSIRRRRGIPYVYVSRWLPRRVAEAAGYKPSRSNGQQFDRYVCPLAKLYQVSEATLQQRVASLPQNPNKQPKDGQHLDRTLPAVAAWHAEAGTLKDSLSTSSQLKEAHPEAHPTGTQHGATADKSSTPGDVLPDLLATIPPTRTRILAWAKDAAGQLAIPREQLAYRLAFYREQLSAMGVRLAQGAGRRTLFVPQVGQDAGTYYSHIWRET